MRRIALFALLIVGAVEAKLDSVTPFLDGEIRCHESSRGYRCNYVERDLLIEVRRSQDVAYRHDTLWKLKTKSENTGCVPVQIVTILACNSPEWIVDEANAGKFEILDLTDLKKPMWIP